MRIRDFKRLLDTGSHGNASSARKARGVGLWGVTVILLVSRAPEASDHRLLVELRQVRTDSGWSVARAEEPNVFLLVHGSARSVRPDRPAESFAAIQVRSLGKSDVQDVKARMESRALKPRDRIGVWSVESVAFESGCYDLKLQGGPAESEIERVRQLWCFNPRFALILIESGPHRISPALRTELHAVMKRSLLKKD